MSPKLIKSVIAFSIKFSKIMANSVSIISLKTVFSDKWNPDLNLFRLPGALSHLMQSTSSTNEERIASKQLPLCIRQYFQVKDILRPLFRLGTFLQMKVHSSVRCNTGVKLTWIYRQAFIRHII